jgi:hypothetical protein
MMGLMSKQVVFSHTPEKKAAMQITAQLQAEQAHTRIHSLLAVRVQTTFTTLALQPQLLIQSTPTRLVLQPPLQVYQWHTRIHLALLLMLQVVVCHTRTVLLTTRLLTSCGLLNGYGEETSC